LKERLRKTKIKKEKYDLPPLRKVNIQNDLPPELRPPEKPDPPVVMCNSEDKGC